MISAYLSSRYQGKETPYPETYVGLPITEEDAMWDNYYYELWEKGCLNLFNFEVIGSTYGVPYHKNASRQIKYFVSFYKEGFNFLELSKEELSTLRSEIETIPDYVTNLLSHQLTSDSTSDILQRFIKAHNTIIRKEEIQDMLDSNAHAIAQEFVTYGNRIEEILRDPKSRSKDNFIRSLMLKLNRLRHDAIEQYDKNLQLCE